jgi:hypothetical protein
MSGHLWTVLPAPKPWPAARILRGSVVQQVVWGLTRSHALRRAQAVLDKHAGEQS